MKKYSPLIRLLLVLFGFVLFFFILTKTDLELLVDTLLHANGKLIFAVVALTLIELWLKSGKWKLIVDKFYPFISNKETFRIFCSAFFVSSFTPSRIGEGVRAFYLKDKLSYGVTLATVFADRFFDLAAILAFAVLAIGILIVQSTGGFLSFLDIFWGVATLAPFC